MEIRELRYITEIARTGNLTKAAENLFVSQPNLSKVLRKLETELHAPLFYKEGKLLCPTEAGKVLLNGAKDILYQVEKIEDSIANLNKLEEGHVSLGIPSVVLRLYFSSILIDFKSRYPNIELDILEGGGVEMQEKVSSGQIDIGIAMRPIENSELNEFLILSDEVMVGMNNTHPLANKTSISLEDLSIYSYATFDSGYCLDKQLKDRLNSAGLCGKAALLTRECNTLTDFSKATNCLCIAPNPILNFYEWPDMVIKPFSPTFPWELSVIYRKNTYLSPAVQAFIQTITDHFICRNLKENFSFNR